MQKQLFVAKKAGLERVGLCKAFYLEDRQSQKPEQDQPSRAEGFVPPSWMSSWDVRPLHRAGCARCAPLDGGWALVDGQLCGYPRDLGQISTYVPADKSMSYHPLSACCIHPTPASSAACCAPLQQAKHHPASQLDVFLATHRPSTELLRDAQGTENTRKMCFCPAHPNIAYLPMFF